METSTFVINVGITRPGVQTNPDFLDKAKLIVRRLIEKRIFLHPRDEVGIILMGSNVTENSLQFPNIQELTPMKVPNWEQVESLMKLEPTNCLGNWAKAIAVALDYIQRQTKSRNKKNLTVLSDFKEEDDVMSQFDADTIIKDLIEQKIHLFLIGIEALDEKPKDLLSTGEKLLMNVCDKVCGCYKTTEKAMVDVRFYKECSTSRVVWKCELELGDLRIPISLCVQREANRPRWKLAINNKKNSNNEVTKITIDTKYSDKRRSIYNEEDTVNGYKYGRFLIPLTKENKEAILYKNCEKSYKIHSFAKREEVDLNYWCGNGSCLVVPSDESSATAFYSLLQAMWNEKVVAIVRKVYKTGLNTPPRMVALFPNADTNITDQPWGFIEIELPFAEDINAFDTKPMESILNQLTQPQEQAIDDLLNSMMLPDDDGITEEEASFSPGTVPTPWMQNLWDKLSYRALHPDKPIPPMDTELCQLLESPDSIKNKSIEPLRRIESLFDLHKTATKNQMKSKDEGRSGTQKVMKMMKDDDNRKNENFDSLQMDVDKTVEDF